ncbi:MAG: tripartite tricarboxylate transporter substrate binding protein [Desulfobacterales bacterium]|jgi:tripartite-type tricarboxylate transporter receptor subunit TctC|nr:tripartite tricarboxylate transporter substrate binding protein [Desulfobacterales bacterium]
MKRLVVTLVVTLVAALALAGPATSQDKFPSKPITVIVPFSAGGSTDLLARAVEKVWPKYSPQPMVIVNKPGGGGVVGTEFVVRSKPDGYTLFLGYGSGHDVVMPHLQKMPYDPFKDLAAVARLSIHSVVICTGAKSEFNTLKDMIAWAKKEGKPVTSSVSTKAGAVDITTTALGKAAGINIVTVPFAGGADAVTTLAGGHVMIGGGHPSEVMPHIKAGRFKPLAVGLPERDPSLPNVPTFKELGIDVYTWGSIKGVAAPAGTPKEALAYLETTLKKVCEDPEFKKMMADLDQPIMYQSGADFAKFLQQATGDYGKLIKDLKISIQ